MEIESAELTTEPKSMVEVKGQEAERLLKLLDALDEQDDVDEVFANFDIPEDVLEKLALLEGREGGLSVCPPREFVAPRPMGASLRMLERDLKVAQ